MSKPEAWKSWEGRQVDGKFTLRQWLGGSDHSAVFLTETAGTPPQKAAIKLMPCEIGSAAEAQVRSLQAKTGLHHRNLLQTFDAGRTQIDGECVVYVVTEFADDNLGQILPERSLDPAEVADMLPPLLEALSYLHEKGLVHGRVRPSNILAVGDQLKLSSDQVRSASELRPVGSRYEYDAPETPLGTLSPASDVWSLGMTLVGAFTQKTLLAQQKPQSDPVVPSNVPEPYRGIAQASLRLDPKQRCSIKEMERRLKDPAHPAEAPTALAPPQPASPEPAATGKRSALPVTVGVVAVLAIVLAIVYFGRSKTSPPPADTQPQETAQAPTSQTSEPAATHPKPQNSAGSVTHQVLPDVPQSARNTITGTVKVVVQAQVDSTGKVTSANLKSGGSSKYFAGLALKAAPRWEFSPPEIDGQPAASTWLIQFRFRRTGIQAAAQKSKR